MQKPEVLTISGRSDCNNTINPDINDLTPAIDGQFIPAESGQGRWFEPAGPTIQKAQTDNI
jgi:hypothetical protein